MATRCNFHRNVGLIGGSLLSLGFAGAQQPAKQPNIVFILMDDMGYGDIGQKRRILTGFAKRGCSLPKVIADPLSLLLPAAF